MQKTIVIASAWAILGAALPIWADPVQVRGGTLTGSDSSITDFRIFGPGFSLAGSADALTPEPHFVCGPCQPGQSVDLSVRYGLAGGLEYNGRTAAGATGLFTFTSEPILIPDLSTDDSAPGRATLTRPFTFSGQVFGVGDGTLDLTGSGAVTVTLLGRAAANQEPSHIDITSTAFRFDTAADPVPEPATVLLVGSGIAGIAAARRRRRDRIQR